MIALSLTLLLYLVSSPVWALQGDVAEALSSNLTAQEISVEDELSGYLDEDDIQGALAFIGRLADEGAIDAKRQRALEDVVWRTKTQKMLDYSKKIREAIKVSDLVAMRDYNQRLQRLREGVTPETESSPLSSDEVASEEDRNPVAVSSVDAPATSVSTPSNARDVAASIEPDVFVGTAQIPEPPEPGGNEMPDFAELPAESAAPTESEEPAESMVQGPAGGPVLGFPPTRTAEVNGQAETASEVSLSPGRMNGVERRPTVRLGNVPRRTLYQALIDDLINDLLERGGEAIANFHLTVAPDGTDSALDIVEQLLIMGDDGEPAAEKLGRRILRAYAALVERDIELGRFDKAGDFIDRMDEVAETAGLPRNEINSLRAELDAAS